VPGGPPFRSFTANLSPAPHSFCEKAPSLSGSSRARSGQDEKSELLRLSGGATLKKIPILKSNAQKFAKSACHEAIYEPR
jgi:hypothetical protein